MPPMGSTPLAALTSAGDCSAKASAALCASSVPSLPSPLAGGAPLRRSTGSTINANATGQ